MWIFDRFFIFSRGPQTKSSIIYNLRSFPIQHFYSFRGYIRTKIKDTNTETYMSSLMPTFPVNMPNAHAQCPVCLSAFLPEDDLGNPGCGHVFHRACIEEWFRVQNNKKCPHCRNSARSSKIQSIYLQFDENPSFIADSTDAASSSRTNEATVCNDSQVQKELDKLKSEYRCYKSKMELEKKEREQSFQFLKVQMTSLETEVESKSRQHSIITSRLQSMKQSSEQMKTDLQCKKLKIEDLRKEMDLMKMRYERDVEHPCKIRTLLQSKSSEIRQRVHDYSQMGEHGLQLLTEFAVAANEESKNLRNQLREMKVEYDLMKAASTQHSDMCSTASLSSVNVRSTSSNILKRAFNNDNSNKSTSSQNSSSSNDSGTISLDHDVLNDFKNLETNKENIYSNLSNGIVEEKSQEVMSNVLKPQKKTAFVPCNEGDDDILMEQTLIESPLFRNSLTKVRGSLLSRKTLLGDSSKRRSSNVMRQYNGLGSSSTKMFQSQPKLKF